MRKHSIQSLVKFCESRCLRLLRERRSHGGNVGQTLHSRLRKGLKIKIGINFMRSGGGGWWVRFLEVATLEHGEMCLLLKVVELFQDYTTSDVDVAWRKLVAKNSHSYLILGNLGIDGGWTCFPGFYKRIWKNCLHPKSSYQQLCKGFERFLMQLWNVKMGFRRNGIKWLKIVCWTFQVYWKVMQVWDISFFRTWRQFRGSKHFLKSKNIFIHESGKLYKQWKLLENSKIQINDQRRKCL